MLQLGESAAVHPALAEAEGGVVVASADGLKKLALPVGTGRKGEPWLRCWQRQRIHGDGVR